MAMKFWFFVCFALASVCAEAQIFRFSTPFSSDGKEASIHYRIDSDGPDEVYVMSPGGQRFDLPKGNVAFYWIDPGHPKREALEAFRQEHQLDFEVFPVEILGSNASVVTIEAEQKLRSFLICSWGSIFSIPPVTKDSKFSWHITQYKNHLYLALSYGDREEKGETFLANADTRSFRRIDYRFHNFEAHPLPTSRELAATQGLMTFPSLNHTFDLARFDRIPHLSSSEQTRPYLDREYEIEIKIALDPKAVPALNINRERTRLVFTLPAVVDRERHYQDLVPSEELAYLRRVFDKVYSKGYYWVKLHNFGEDDRQFYSADNYFLLPASAGSFKKIPLGALDNPPQLYVEPWNPAEEPVLFDVREGQKELMPEDLELFCNQKIAESA